MFVRFDFSPIFGGSSILSVRALMIYRVNRPALCSRFQIQPRAFLIDLALHFKEITMNKTKFTLSVLATFVFVVACATAAQAQTQRSFVAGPGIGLDTNNTAGQGFCSFTNPCRNFSVAYAVTNTGGEIIALSPGVGYGGLAITHAITVTGLPGQVAFVAVTAGISGFTVAAGASEQVVIRNITFNGSGSAGSIGLTYSSGKLILEGCNFTQLATGVRGTGGNAIVNNSSFTANSSKGLHISGNTTAMLINSVVANNATGLTADGNCTFTNIRVDSGSIIYNTLGVEMLNANVAPGGCPAAQGSLPGNIFVRSDGGLRPNIFGNTTAVGPSPGAGLQAVIPNYQSTNVTNY